VEGIAFLGESIGMFVVSDLVNHTCAHTVCPQRIINHIFWYVIANITFDYSSPAGYSSLIQAMFTYEFWFFGAEIINPITYGIISPILIIARLHNTGINIAHD
jgi:hypothetical protein